MFSSTAGNGPIQESTEKAIVIDGQSTAQDAADAAKPPESTLPAQPGDQRTDVEVVVESPESLVTLGSLDVAGEYRYLVTLSNKGAAIVRLELNARDRKGNFVYRDLEHFGGYLGKLELSKNEKGALVGVVGVGTPAWNAGLRSGDVIAKLNDVPVTSPDDFNIQLTKTKNGQELQIGYIRREGDAEVSKTATVTLTDQPLELLSREVDFVEPGTSSPSSFHMKLLKVGDAEWTELDPKMLDGDWKVARITDNLVDFQFELAVEKLIASGIQDVKGPIVITKRFSLPQLTKELASDLNSRTFDLRYEIIVENKTQQALKGIGIQLNGSTGATTEGWWYQNKIHGRSTAVGYIAGARDVVFSTTGRPFIFKGCPEIVDETRKSVNPQFVIAKPSTEAEQKNNEIKFVGVDTQYFNISLLPVFAETNSDAVYQCYSALPYVASNRIPKASKSFRKVDCSYIVFDVIDLPLDGTYRQSFEIFAGPKQKPLLITYGLESNLTFGWFAIFSQGLCWLLRFFYTITFGISYGIAIILLTVLVRGLMLPISRKAAKNAQMMQLLAPEMKRIADKYKDNLEKRGQAQKELFRRYNYNPAGGCLLMFLQLPIFIGLYKGLSVDIALRDQPLISGMSWCSNLAAPDHLWYWKDFMPGFLGSEAGWLGPYFNVLPLITIVLFLIQQKLFTPPPTDDQQAMTQKIMSYMMIFMGVMFFKVPSGLCLYFITSSIWGILERQLLPKAQLSEDKVNFIKGSLGENVSDSTSVRENSKTEKPTTPNGFMSRIKDVLDSAQKKNSTIVNDPEKMRQIDKDRRRRLRERDN